MLPDMSHDVRWDGQRFQWFNLADSTLVVSRKVEQKTPYIAEPIPLLPVAFLNPAGDDLGVKLSLTEVRSDQTLGRLPTAHFVVGNGGEVEFPGGAIGKTEFTYRIDFGTSPSYLPTKISRISSDGVELTTTELSYQPVQCASGTVYLPRWARMTNRTTDNRVFMVTTCTVTSIDADTIVAPETFTLNFQTAKTVLDMDRPRHLAIGGTNPNDGARFADQAASQTAPKDAALSVETALLTPAAKTDGDNDQWPVVNMALLLIGLIALSAGSATIFRKRRLSGGPQ
jgi:hypothetical protein